MHKVWEDCARNSVTLSEPLRYYSTFLTIVEIYCKTCLPPTCQSCQKPAPTFAGGIIDKYKGGFAPAHPPDTPVHH